MIGCLASALLLLCGSCSPQTEPVSIQTIQNYSVEQYFNERDSTVVVLNPDRLQPSCSAVSVYDSDGSAVLATAAHCLMRKVDKFDPAPNAEKEAHVGDGILYVTRNDWFYTGSDAMRAKIKTLDLVRDRAMLSVNQFEVPMPLMKAKYCYPCTFDGDQVHSVSAVYNWDRHKGTILNDMYSGIDSRFFESDLTIDYGWSGSPVFTENGEVLGLVIRCNPSIVQVNDRMVRKCVPGWSLITSIP